MCRRYLYAVPQPIGNQLVRRPNETAPLDVRNEYAAWVLGNFFPYTCYDHAHYRADNNGFVDLIRELLYSCYPRSYDAYNYNNMDSYDKTAWWQHLKRWEYINSINYEGFIIPNWLKREVTINENDEPNGKSHLELQHHYIILFKLLFFRIEADCVPSTPIYPRFQQDKFALRCVGNIELQLAARSLMSSESKKAKILERRILETTGHRTTKGNTVYSDCDEVTK